MDAVNHALRVRIARSLERMVAPGVEFPVVPVLYDIVAGNTPTAKLTERLRNFIGSLIALTALPEAQHPLRVDRSLARQRAITADDLVGIATGYEVIIHVTSHLAPDAEPVLSTIRPRHAQAAVTGATVGLPLNTQRITVTGTQELPKLIGVRIPGRAPSLGHHLFATDKHLDITSIVEHEVVEIISMMTALFLRFDESLIDHARAIQIEACRQVLDTSGLSSSGQFGGGRTVELVVDGILVANDGLALTVGIGAGQVAFPTLLVIELEDVSQLLVFLRIAPATIAVAVPQQTIISV